MNYGSYWRNNLVSFAYATSVRSLPGRVKVLEYRNDAKYVNF
jgi:hypothetical protein